MRKLKIVLLIFVAGVAVSSSRFIVTGSGQGLSEAAVGIDNLSNGFTDQKTFAADLDTFAKRESLEEGLGPVYNATSCADCHQNPIVGGSSQVSVLRAGHRDIAGVFVSAPGGSLIHDRAIDPSIQEFVPDGENVRAFRMSLSILGDGFVEAVDDQTFVHIAMNQPAQSAGQIQGQVVRVPLLEAPGVTRVGRFGWKNQHASLLSFSADAYLNEMGITTPLLPEENTSLGRSVKAFDKVADPEDDGKDIDAFARFMRSTKAAPKDLNAFNSPDGRAGEQLFNQIGCVVCHVSSIATAPPGTVFNGGKFVVSQALGGKVFHPYGDYLLHNIGTGDGIVQNGDNQTANKVRTAPLWGIRSRDRYMHDGASLTLDEAITRHAGEANLVITRYRVLSDRQKQQIQKFVKCL